MERGGGNYMNIRQFPTYCFTLHGERFIASGTSTTA